MKCLKCKKEVGYFSPNKNYCSAECAWPSNDPTVDYLKWIFGMK